MSATARQSGRRIRAFALVLTACTAAVVRAADEDDRIIAVELEIGAGIESWHNPVALPGDDGTTIAVERRAERVSSPFREATLNIDMELPATADWAWTGSWTLETRRSPDLPLLDRNHHNIAFGILHELDGGDLGIEALVEQLDIDNADFRRRANGARIEYAIRAARDDARTITIEWKRYRHDAPGDTADGDRIGLAWTHRHTGETGAGSRYRIAAAGLFNRHGFDDASWRELSARVERFFVPAPGWTTSLALAARWTHFLDHAPDATFIRIDRRLTGVVAAAYHAADRASVQCEVEAGRLASNDAQARSRWNIAGCSLRLVF